MNSKIKKTADYYKQLLRLYKIATDPEYAKTLGLFLNPSRSFSINDGPRFNLKELRHRIDFNRNRLQVLVREAKDKC